MLKKKLDNNKAIQKSILNLDDQKEYSNSNTRADGTVTLSEYFGTPIWKQFYDLECILNANLRVIKPPKFITHIYNPLEYAADIHVKYLRKYLDGPKNVMFVGMNPGPNGMAQTGVPFGNISTVRNLMQLSGRVEQPEQLHHKRPINGLQCQVEEPSGVRLWQLLYNIAGQSLDTFSKQCFVHNFCPLAFFDKGGKNITPNELKGEFKGTISNLCLSTFDELVALVEPIIIIAVGEYVYGTLKKSVHYDSKTILKLAHPSPRSLNNQNWPEKAETFFKDNDNIKFIRNYT